MGSNPAIPTIDSWRRIAISGPPFPYLEKVAMDAALQWLGFGLCHQLPERSFFGGGLQVPVCARDTGIYVGFVISWAVLLVLHRRSRPREFPSLPVALFLGLLVAFMGWDGVTSYAGMRSTTNLIRLASGMGTGFAAAVLIMPMLNDTLWRRQTQTRILSSPWRFGVWAGCIIAATAAVWLVGPVLGAAYPLLVGLCIVITLTTINLVLVAMLPRFDRVAEGIRDLRDPVALALGIALVEIVASGLVRLGLDALARSV